MAGLRAAGASASDLGGAYRAPHHLRLGNVALLRQLSCGVIGLNAGREQHLDGTVDQAGLVADR
jgi:hypothetical protein